jgi:hypothetical protein
MPDEDFKNQTEIEVNIDLDTLIEALLNSAKFVGTLTDGLRTQLLKDLRSKKNLAGPKAVPSTPPQTRPRNPTI